MYNFTSNELFSPSQDSPARSTSLNKLGDISPILRPQNTRPRGKSISSETKLKLFPSSKDSSPNIRPATSEIRLFTKSPKLSARSPSPQTFCTTNRSAFRTNEAQNEMNVQVYEALKEQKRMFFTRGSSLASEVSLKKLLTQEKDVSKDSTMPLLLGIQRPSSRQSQKSFSPSLGMSPRKRLSQSPVKMYNVKVVRLKESMKKTAVEWGALMKNKQVKSERNVYQEKPKEEVKSAYMRELEKTMNEERKAMERLGNVSSEKFGAKLNMYNKYFAEYLDEPALKYVEQADLKVDVKSILAETAKPFDERFFGMKKTEENPKGFGILKVLSASKKFKETEGALRSPPRNIVSVKFSGEKEGRPKSEYMSSRTNDEEGGDGKYMELINLLGKEKTRVEANLRSLEKMGSLIEHKSSLSKQEQLFFKHVKDGKLAEVQMMLMINSELHRAKDLRNQTPMHWAIKRGMLDIIGELVTVGADMDVLDMAGRKPLDLVAGSNKKEILDLIDKKFWELKRKTANSGV